MSEPTRDDERWARSSTGPAGGSDERPGEALARLDRLVGLGPVERDVIRLANEPGFTRWLDLVAGTGGCAEPVYLAGATTVYATATGEVVYAYDTDGEPGGRLPVACGNRRASRCAACSARYRADAYHLVRAGLAGGKGVPDEVAGHPAVFATLTAPSFGAVHRATHDERPCRPRRGGGVCEHGKPIGCGLRHGPDDRLVGQPLCPGCYDYLRAVLWNAHAGRLWRYLLRDLGRDLARVGGIPRSKVGAHVRIGYVRVAEYQARGAVHFHAVMRLDGPTRDVSPPAWATAQALEACLRRAAAGAVVRTPESAAVGSYELRWGSQLDVQPIGTSGTVGVSGGGRIDVASYIAKYTTKASEAAGAVDRAITHRWQIDALPVTPHVRALLLACWRLGRLPEFANLRLRPWAHMLGYRGHAVTKARGYSTTFSALRGARYAYRRAENSAPEALDIDGLGVDLGVDLAVDRSWRFVGRGHTPGAAEIASGIAEDLAVNRRTARDAREGGADERDAA